MFCNEEHQSSFCMCNSFSSFLCNHEYPVFLMDIIIGMYNKLHAQLLPIEVIKKTSHASVGEALSFNACGAFHIPRNEPLTLCLVLLPSFWFCFLAFWSQTHVLINCLTVLFSFQQKQVLCHLPLPLHEWPIAPWPYVQLVKM